jgi:hypothetical protein
MSVFLSCPNLHSLINSRRASTASVSATASEIIAVDDLYYNNTMNAGIAIFTILASQLLGYGFAGSEVQRRALAMILTK